VKRRRGSFLPANLAWAVRSRLLGPERAARRLGATVGSDCRILSFNVSSEPFLVEIGDRVTIAVGVQLITHDGAGSLAVDDRGRRYHYAPVRVLDDVFVGLNAIILPGVTIGPCSIVAAGSVVTRPVPPGVVVAGNPARVVGSFAAYRDRALRSWPTDSGRQGRSYAQWVLDVAEQPTPVTSAGGDPS
jgi:acetyltransferase-like isoleucine patch superfamily enzyme